MLAKERSWLGRLGTAVLLLLACSSGCTLGKATVANVPGSSAHEDGGGYAAAADASVPGESTLDGASMDASDAGADTPEHPVTDGALALPPDAAVRLMIVGDSITQGSAGDFTWRYRLHALLATAGVRFDLVGTRDDLFDNIENVQGSQAYADPNFDRDHDALWGGSLQEALKDIRAHVLATRADVLLVLLGTNDLTFFTDAPHSEQNLRTFISNARAGNGRLALVLGHVLPKRGADATFLAAAADLNTRFDAVARELATTTSAISIASPEQGYDTTLDSYDGVHPNASGELRIAAAFADALSSTLHIGAPARRPLPAVPIGPQTVPTLQALPLDRAAQLSWTSAPGATGYFIWMRNATKGEASTRLPLAVKSPWTAQELTNGNTYEFRVQPTKWDAAGVVTRPVSVTPSP
jgi:hypothetical protein